MRIAVAAVDLAEKLQCLQKNKETAGELTARDEQVAGLLVQGEQGEVHGAGRRQGDSANIGHYSPGLQLQTFSSIAPSQPN